MAYRVLADLVVLLHLFFIVFAVLGGLLALKRRGWAWVHLPAVLWAALDEFAGWICPLTPLENWLRDKGGTVGYEGSFIEHYIIPIIYPATLTRGLQVVLGLFVVVINLVIYGFVIKRYRKGKALKKRRHRA